MVGEVRTTDLQDILLGKDPDTQQKLENENRQLELTCRIKDQKIFDLEQQSVTRNTIDSIRRRHDDEERNSLKEERNSLKEENRELQRQLEEFKKKRSEEFSADNEVEMIIESKVCDRQDCDYIGLHCKACHCHIATEAEMQEHRAICTCNPQSHLFGR